MLWQCCGDGVTMLWQSVGNVSGMNWVGWGSFGHDLVRCWAWFGHGLASIEHDLRHASGIILIWAFYGHVLDMFQAYSARVLSRASCFQNVSVPHGRFSTLLALFNAFRSGCAFTAHAH